MTDPIPSPEAGPDVTSAAAPVADAPQPSDPHRRHRLYQTAAWVGIVAGVVFIVGAVFLTGFILGRHSGDGRYGLRHQAGMYPPGPPMNRGGCPMMDPDDKGPGMMGPGMMGPGMMGPGMVGPGMMDPDDRGPGMMQPGMMQPGMMQPGRTGPGTPPPSSPPPPRS